MFQTGMFINNSDFLWIRVGIHQGGMVKGYLMMDFEEEIEKWSKKIDKEMSKLGK